MRLALFDDLRLAVVADDGRSISEVSDAITERRDADRVGAGWWVRMCRDFPSLRPLLEASARRTKPTPIDQVRLRAPVLNPTKVIACAITYDKHQAEAGAVHARSGGEALSWLFQFDIFLKAPSSIVGPSSTVELPSDVRTHGKEVHHECELALVVGTGGAHIPEANALSHVLGYTIALDMTVRGDGDRSRRKSYDTFTPIGPWITTADQVPDPHNLEVRLKVNGQVRQAVNTREMSKTIAEIVSYASSVMCLEPGDVILTGAPAGVAKVNAGDVMDAEISGLGSMRLGVRRAEGPERVRPES